MKPFSRKQGGLAAGRRNRPPLFSKRRSGVCRPLLSAAGLLAAVFLLAAPAAAAEQGQRFILFNAEYNSSLKQLSKTTVFLEKRLFKLDTKTGDTWVLVDVLQDGKDIRYWKKINDYQGK